jgi:probable rRNA maturation factor
MANVQIFSEYPGFTFRKKLFVARWLREILSDRNARLGEISIVFMTDDALLSMNREYLAHDYYTDIITFDYTADFGGKISGDLFISLDRVRENAAQNHVSTEAEIFRVIAHGVLHLLGYEDQTAEQKQQIRLLEDSFIAHNSHLSGRY